GDSSEGGDGADHEGGGEQDEPAPILGGADGRQQTELALTPLRHDDEPGGGDESDERHGQRDGSENEGGHTRFVRTTAVQAEVDLARPTPRDDTARAPRGDQERRRGRRRPGAR